MVFSRTRARSGGPAHDTERHPFTLGGTVRVPFGTTSMGAAGASRRSSAASTSCGTVTNPTTMSYPTTAQSSGRSEPTTPGPFGSRRASEPLATPRERFGGARSLSAQSERNGNNVLHQRGPPLDLDAGLYGSTGFLAEREFRMPQAPRDERRRRARALPSAQGMSTWGGGGCLRQASAAGRWGYLGWGGSFDRPSVPAACRGACRDGRIRNLLSLRAGQQHPSGCGQLLSRSPGSRESYAARNGHPLGGGARNSVTHRCTP